MKYNNFCVFINQLLQILIPQYIQNFLGINLANYRHIEKLLNQKLLHLVHINADLHIYQKFQNQFLFYFYYIPNGLFYPIWAIGPNLLKEHQMTHEV